MIRKIATILFILILPTVVHAQTDYTIPKKHRVIQEKLPDSQRVPVGTKLSDITFTTLPGNTRSLGLLITQGPAIFVFLAAECPVAQRYAMRLKRMHTKFADKHVTLIGVYANENDSVDDIKAYLAKAEFPFPIVKDTDGSLARHLGATMTPQAHLIDSRGVLRYRGPIDDNRYETRIKHNYLRDALVAVLDGKPVPVKETPAFGCTIHLPEQATQKQITYSEHIAPILQKNCQTCHQQNGFAPFALLSYDDAKTHGAKIAEYTQARLMPPWKPVHGYGDFKNERRLTDTEIEMITTWVKTNTPAGPAIHHTPITSTSETWTWTLGEPDWVTEIPLDFKALPVGKRGSHLFALPTGFDKAMSVQAIDFQLENRKSVRGITANFGKKMAVTPTASGGQATPNYTFDGILTAWTPGVAPPALPAGVGHLLPKGAHLILNVLYQGTGHHERDTLQVGLYFSKTPETAQLHTATLINGSSYRFKTDVHVFAAYPSMGISKQDMQIIAITPIGEHIPMLHIKASDTDWHDIYHYRKPLFLPAGSRLEFVNQKNLKNKGNKNATDMICYFLYTNR